MPCQIGIFESPDSTLDSWSSLLYLEDHRSPRDVLRAVAPFLRHFQTHDVKHDVESLGAWLTWHLIDSGITAGTHAPGISLSREIRSDIDFFYRISPGRVEVYRVDEVLDWRMIGALEIPRKPAEVQAQAR